MVEVGDIVIVDQYGEGQVVDIVPGTDAVLVELESGDQWFTTDDLTVVY